MIPARRLVLRIGRASGTTEVPALESIDRLSAFAAVADVASRIQGYWCQRIRRIGDLSMARGADGAFKAVGTIGASDINGFSAFPMELFVVSFPSSGAI